MSKNVINITRSLFTEKFFCLNGQPFSLNDYPHMRDIYNSQSKEIVMKFSRQTAKSTTMANICLADALMNPYFKVMYVSPTIKQTKVFSNDRVAPIIEGSPLIKDYYINASLVQNVFTKQFLNGSRVYLQYALLNADKLRGISSDKIFFDECQDLKKEVLPVIQESMSRSLFKQSVYSGTPKRTKGTLADLWYNSTMYEYAIKCTGCNHWNILVEDNIGLKGVICSKCGKSLKVKDSELEGEWVSTHPDNKNPDIEGYRVCILHFDGAPWVNWKSDILDKRERNSRAIFYNESLAIEYDDGVSPLNESDIIACCNNNVPMYSEPSETDRSYTSVMGIDYGPMNSENSYTTITILQRRVGKYHIVFMKKFIGKEADYTFIHKEIPRLMSLWNCSILAADAGMGEASNSEFRSKLGYDKIFAFQHHHSQKELLHYNSKMQAYTLNRNQAMQLGFNAIKKRKVEFPSWEYTKPFADDMLNIQAEYNEELGNMKYVNIGPDDFFHSTLYALMGAEMLANSLGKDPILLDT